MAKYFYYANGNKLHVINETRKYSDSIISLCRRWAMNKEIILVDNPLNLPPGITGCKTCFPNTLDLELDKVDNG